MVSAFIIERLLRLASLWRLAEVSAHFYKRLSRSKNDMVWAYAITTNVSGQNYMNPKAAASCMGMLRIAGAIGAAACAFTRHPRGALFCFVVTGLALIVLGRIAGVSWNTITLKKPIPAARFYTYMGVGIVLSVCGSIYVVLRAHGAL